MFVCGNSLWKNKQNKCTSCWSFVCQSFLLSCLSLFFSSVWDVSAGHWTHWRTQTSESVGYFPDLGSRMSRTLTAMSDSAETSSQQPWLGSGQLPRPSQGPYIPFITNRWAPLPFHISLLKGRNHIWSHNCHNTLFVFLSLLYITYNAEHCLIVLWGLGFLLPFWVSLLCKTGHWRHFPTLLTLFLCVVGQPTWWSEGPCCSLWASFWP